MNLLFISEYFYPRKAGGEVWSWEFCTALAKKGIAVTVLTGRHDESKKEETLHGVRILRPHKTVEHGFIRRKRAAQKLTRTVAQYLRTNTVDVIHVNAYALNVQVSRLAKQHGIPCITSVHSYFGGFWNQLTVLGPLLKRLERAALKKDCSAVIHVPSKQMQERIGRDTGKEMLVIPHWCPARFPKPRKLPKGTRVFVGSLEHVKNPLACIPASKGNTLIMIGSGSLDAAVQRAARKARLDCTFIKETSHDDVLAYIGGASLVLVPSMTESFSLVALEAVSQGVPVAGTPVGIIPELPGVIPFPPKSSPKKLDKKTVQHIRKTYNQNTIINEFVSLYKKVRT